MRGVRLVAPVSVNAATVFVVSRDKIPVGFPQGAAHVTVKVSAPLSGAIGSLKVAVVTAVLIDTAVAASAGVTAITVGARAAEPPEPRIGSPSAPHPAAKVPSSNAVNHITHLEYLSNLFICLPRNPFWNPIGVLNRPLFVRTLTLSEATGAHVRCPPK